ncbi:glycosyltransferase family 2 protein [Providencia rettgeri]|uniref:glycosyltransferase family 2 protein n=1 Tax=Providencia rettgeri TaxID=587 RepID=UPI00235EEF0E|nr:glycosyltransferase family 2 protein [Providencia rettgeri]
MKFSIVLPTYNVEKYIRRSLQSCIDQSYQNIEVIVVDDCGQDNSLEIANEFAKNDSRIKIIQYKKNVGTFHARRIGTEHASGDYILFLDPDDEIDLNTIKEIHKQLDKSPDLVLYGSKRIPSPKFWQLSPKIPDIIDLCNYTQSLNSIFKCKRLSYGTEGKVIKRNILLDAYGLLDVPKDKRIIYGEDALLFSSILLSAKKVLTVPPSFYIYYKNESSITESINKDLIRNNIFQLDFIIDMISNLPNKNENTKIIKTHVNERLNLDKLRLLNKIEGKKFAIVKNHLMIIAKTKSIRDILKLFIFLLPRKKKNKQ